MLDFEGYPFFMGNTGKKLTLEQREEVLVRVESLMVRGIQSAGEVAKEINCSIPTAREYMRAIHVRWQAQDGQDFVGMRGELLSKTRKLEQAYWEKAEKADNTSAGVGALNGILEIHKFQAFITGINKVMKST